MDRPYMICHILSALDGKISGAFMGTEAAQSAGAEYGRIRSAYRAEAWLYGTTTTKEFTHYQKPVLKSAYENLPAGDYIAENDLKFYYVSLDTMGEIGWESGTFRKPGRPDSHVIEILTENTPLAYRAYLREKGVSYTAEVVITLNNSRAAADLVDMLPLELTLIERNSFAKGMTLPARLSSEEETTRSYEIGDFGYWDAGPDLAIFYDDIYEQTVVPVIPLGKAESGAEMLSNASGTVRLELVKTDSE